MENSNEVTQRCPQIYVSPTSKYQFSERHGNQYHAHSLRRCTCCQTSLRLGLARIEASDKTKSPRGGLTVLDLLTTKAFVLFGFSIMHQLLHHSWILAMSMLREGATAGMSAGSRTTASSVESSAYANSLFSTSSNTFHWYVE